MCSRNLPICHEIRDDDDDEDRMDFSLPFRVPGDRKYIIGFNGFSILVLWACYLNPRSLMSMGELWLLAALVLFQKKLKGLCEKGEPSEFHKQRIS